MRVFSAFLFAAGLTLCCGCKPQNVFSFCRDFDPSGCISPVSGTVSYPLAKTNRSKTGRDFANSVYFRGDRLAFELKNAHSKYDVTFECLHGRYTFGDAAAEKQELEYLELREKNVYGLVMVGSLIEKKYGAGKILPYRPLDPFPVKYSVLCGKDIMAEHTIVVELK